MYMLLSQRLHRQRPSITNARWAALLFCWSLKSFSGLELHSTLPAALHFSGLRFNLRHHHCVVPLIVKLWPGAARQGPDDRKNPTVPVSVGRLSSVCTMTCNITDVLWAVLGLPCHPSVYDLTLLRKPLLFQWSLKTLFADPGCCFCPNIK